MDKIFYEDIYLGIVLRKLYSFLKLYGFKLNDLDFEGKTRDGMYIVFYNKNKNIKINLQYVLWYDLTISKKGLFKDENISLESILAKKTGKKPYIKDISVSNIVQLNEKLDLYVKYLKNNISLID